MGHENAHSGVVNSERGGAEKQRERRRRAKENECEIRVDLKEVLEIRADKGSPKKRDARRKGQQEKQAAGEANSSKASEQEVTELASTARRSE